jgi:hypothetical protein
MIIQLCIKGKDCYVTGKNALETNQIYYKIHNYTEEDRICEKASIVAILA